jgi:hypothetical protein
LLPAAHTARAARPCSSGSSSGQQQQQRAANTQSLGDSDSEHTHTTAAGSVAVWQRMPLGGLTHPSSEA